MWRWLILATIAAISFAPVAVQAQATVSQTAVRGSLATPTVQDMALLKKAIDAVQKNPVLIKSDLHAKATCNGAVLSINESIKVVGLFPGKFTSEIVVLDEDGKTAAAKFQVIGDVTNVYTYQPATRQYGVQPVEAFRKDFAMPAIGIVGALIGSGQQWAGDDPPADDAGVAAFLEMLKQGAGMTLESGPGTNGQRVFEMRVGADSGTVIRLTAEPATQSFVRVEMQTRMNQWNISLVENIQSQAKLSSLNDPVFTPPADTTKVGKLTVWPF